MKFAVLGSGNGGHAFTAELWARGFETNLFDLTQFEQPLQAIKKRGGIELVSGTEAARREKGTYFVEKNGKITTNISEAIDDVDVAITAVPAYAHKVFAEHCAKYLEDGQIVVLVPGDTGGAIEFSKVISDVGANKHPIIAEALSLPFACRISGPAQVKIKAIKGEIPVAALPATDTEKVMELLKPAFPEFVPAKHVLETGLNRPSIALHPVSTLLNVVKIEQMGAYKCQGYDVTPSVAKVMEAVDRERLEVVKALGVEAVSIKDRLFKFYGAKGNDLYETIHNCPAYKEQTAPPNLQSRYITEDVPYVLVPTSSLGDLLGIKTPTMKSLIQIASTINETDYWQEGRTVEKLGLTGMNSRQIMKFVTED